MPSGSERPINCLPVNIENSFVVEIREQHQLRADDGDRELDQLFRRKPDDTASDEAPAGCDPELADNASNYHRLHGTHFERTYIQRPPKLASVDASNTVTRRTCCSVLSVLVGSYLRRYSGRWIRTTALRDMNPPELAGYSIPLAESPCETNSTVASLVIHANSEGRFFHFGPKETNFGRSQQ